MASEHDPESMADAPADQDYNQRAAAHIRELSNVNQVRTHAPSTYSLFYQETYIFVATP